MNLIQTFITKNDCYKAGRTIVPKGIMVHSTATPGVMAKDWFSRWNKPGLEVPVHAFVDDQFVCQHLPWNHRAWHCGDAANNTHIAFELCEPTDWKTNRTYALAAYRNGVELAAALCRKYGLNEKAIISHAEGYRQGIASNHGDPDHWWRYFGLTMAGFRADVAAALSGGQGAAPALPENRPQLSEGSEGAAVTALQRRLNQLRIALALAFEPLAEDGIFGPRTKEAVRAFQSARGLAADGIVGPKTWAALAVSYGDVDQNGKVNAADALRILQSAVGKRTLSESERAAADLNGDGSANAADALGVLREAVKGP